MLSVDGLACFFVMVALGVFFWLWKGLSKETCALIYSHLPLFQDKPSWRVKGAKTSDLGKGCALICFLIAFIHPQWVVTKPPQGEQEIEGPLHFDEVNVPTEGLAIYFVLDCSSSMKENMVFKDQKGRFSSVPRMKVLKEMTGEFIKGNPQLGLSGRKEDLLGVIGFARRPEVLSPLTLDHQEILKQVGNLDVVRESFDDGTGIGYAIFKTTCLIEATQQEGKKRAEGEKAPYTIVKPIVILVTDGIQNPHPDDRGNALRTISVQQAALKAKEGNVNLYIIHIDSEALMGWPQELETLQRAAKLTGGEFFAANSLSELVDVYRQIEELQKQNLPSQKRLVQAKERQNLQAKQTKHYLSLSPFFLGAGLIALLWGILAETLFFRRIP